MTGREVGATKGCLIRSQLALSALLISVIGILVLITFITAVTVTMLSRSAALRNPVGPISTE